MVFEPTLLAIKQMSFSHLTKSIIHKCKVVGPRRPTVLSIWVWIEIHRQKRVGDQKAIVFTLRVLTGISG